VGAAIGFLVALTLATPAGSPAPARLSSLRPINLSLPAPPPARTPKTLAPGFFTTPIPKPPPPPTWVRAMFGDPDHPPSGSGTRSSGSHGGRGFGRGFGGGHACHGGGHH
jgi:hypothetical protein